MNMYPLELVLQNLEHPLELVLLRNKDPWNLFHCNIWTPSNNNYIYGPQYRTWIAVTKINKQLCTRISIYNIIIIQSCTQIISICINSHFCLFNYLVPRTICLLWLRIWSFHCHSRSDDLRPDSPCQWIAAILSAIAAKASFIHVRMQCMPLTCTVTPS